MRAENKHFLFGSVTWELGQIRTHEPERSGCFAEWIEALGRCGTPHFPAPMWHRCLAEANEFDTARMLTASYAKIDAAEYFAPRVAYYERLCGSSITTRNGHPLKLAASAAASRGAP
jgi:hypothetical protein